MDRRTFIGTIAVGLVAPPLAVEAQQTGKVHRIGFILTAASQEAVHLAKALDDGLRELG